MAQQHLEVDSDSFYALQLAYRRAGDTNKAEELKTKINDM